MGNICQEEGFTQGFDRFKLFPYKNGKEINRQLEEWAKEIKAQKKYFLYIHYNDCHVPYHPWKPWYKPQKKKRRDLIARYDSEINYVDTKIKKMYELFGWDKNTLLIVTSDHGEEFGEHKGKGHGQSLYSEVIRVPLLIYFPPGDRVHKRVKINVSNIDILPTVRGYLDIESNEVEAGINLMPAIDGNESNMHERYIFSHLLKHSRDRDGKKMFHKATIFEEWKYIFVDKFQKSLRRELYNMKEDPREKSNAYKENETLAKLLFSKFAAFEKNCKKFDQEIKRLKIDKKKMEELKTLGYVE
jgi:arylsulfatase A-like enzyme